MAEFLKDSQVLTAIEELIEKADQYLLLISPYIKLHERVKDRLKAKKKNTELKIAVIFGKNEDDTSRSLSREDFDFLKDFPNILIGYEKRLHAKYYASEDFSIITSMNLHEFSQNNNIEIGIKLKAKNWLQVQIAKDNIDYECANYFEEVVENCTVIFEREPKYKSGILGIPSSYLNSETLLDDSEQFFQKKETFQGKKYSKIKTDFLTKTETGFCIRTGKPISFNPLRPMSKEAYDSWSQYKNPDYAEKYCHKTGKLSNGKTSMRKPIL